MVSDTCFLFTAVLIKVLIKSLFLNYNVYMYRNKAVCRNALSILATQLKIDSSNRTIIIQKIMYIILCLSN